MTERYEEFVYREGYRRGFEAAKAEVIAVLKTKTIKYYDEDENVWKIGEVIIDDNE